MLKNKAELRILNPTQKEFAALMTAAGWSAAETSRQLNCSRANVTYILKGQSTPRPSMMELLRSKVIAAREKGKEPAKGEGAREGAEPSLKSVLHGFFQTVTAPIIAYAQGGEGAYPADLEHASPRIPVACKDPNCYVLQLEGDSMEPIYSPGDLLIVSPNTPYFSGDLVIVKTVDDEVFFKKYRAPKKGEILEFLSFNPHHPPVYLRPDQIYRISAVHSVLKPLKEKVRAMTVSESTIIP